MKYGPIRDAPNPVQRYMLSRPYLVFLFLTGMAAVATLPIVALAVLGGAMPLWVAVCIEAGIVLVPWPMLTVKSGVHRESVESLENGTAAYLPWFPRRGGRVEAGVPREDVDETELARLGYVRRENSRDRLQRLAVERPGLASVVSAVVLSLAISLPFWLAVAVSPSTVRVLVLVAVIALVSAVHLVAYLVGDLRHLSAEQRGRQLVIERRGLTSLRLRSKGRSPDSRG